jgi:hypothetical protein
MPQLQPPKSRQSFPPIPEFYGGEVGPRVTNETATNQQEWGDQYRKSVPPTKPILDVLMDIANDPRNAWMGLGPVGMAVKGSRLIKPLVAAEQGVRPSSWGALPAKQKSLKWSGSEPAARILDYDPQLGHTTNPILGGPGQTAASVVPGWIGPQPTADEIVAAQDILKKMAQQNAPKTMTLYRGGEPIRHSQYSQMKPPFNPNTPVPATSDLKIATDFTQSNVGLPSPLFELKVPREDLLANIDKLQRGRGYRESEYLIPLRSFQGAQTRLPFPNPVRVPESEWKGGTYLKGAQFKDVLENSPFTQPAAQQSMKYGKPVAFDALHWKTNKADDTIYSSYLPGFIDKMPSGKFMTDIPGIQPQTFETLEEAKLHLFNTDKHLHPYAYGGQ